MTGDPKIVRSTVASYIVPTDRPEADGTLEWTSTTIVVVQIEAGGVTGLGYGYADTATARLIADRLAAVIHEREAMDVAGAWLAMVRAIRNLGRPGIASMAIAAVDIALWDLKAKLLRVPLAALLGSVRTAIPVYGSGGFTSYSVAELQDQLSGWTAEGITRVKMKVGANPTDDVMRVEAAREAIGDGAELYVDANGAYSRKQALAFAHEFFAAGATWFEEPVSSDDLEGLRLIRDHAPAGMDVTAGEYGYDLVYFRRMLSAGAVDVLQPDATRCAGITEFVKVGALCDAWALPLSSHTAPSVHAHLCCAVPAARHAEYFHDHARIERLFFEGALLPVNGVLIPDASRPGLGLELRRADVAKYAS